MLSIGVVCWFMPYNIKYFRGNIHVFLHIFVFYVLMENFDSAMRNGKGAKDRITMLPELLKKPLQDHLLKVRTVHERDLAEGWGRVQARCFGSQVSQRASRLALAMGLSAVEQMEKHVTVHPFWFVPVFEKDTPLSRREYKKSPLGRGLRGW